MYPEHMVEKFSEAHKKRHYELVNLADHLLNNDWEQINPKNLIIKNGNLDVLEYFKHEGYWKGDMQINSHYPLPETNKFKKEDSDVFLDKLIWLEKEIANKNGLLKGATKINYMGVSQCRCCGKNNGSGEYYYQGWSWPDGYMHYLVDHKVEPSAAFMVFVNTTYDKYRK